MTLTVAKPACPLYRVMASLSVSFCILPLKASGTHSVLKWCNTLLIVFLSAPQRCTIRIQQCFPTFVRPRPGKFFDAEYICGFVWWGVCKQSRWRHSVTVPSRHKMADMRYYGNVMIFYVFNTTVIDWTCNIFFLKDEGPVPTNLLVNTFPFFLSSYIKLTQGLI